MTEFPPLDDELRPKVRLKKHADVLPTTDKEIEANSRRIGEKWGATTASQLPCPQYRSRLLSPVFAATFRSTWTMS